MTTILLATDADWIHDDVEAALGSEGTEVKRVRAGKQVYEAVLDCEPDLVILDMQIGNMGGMAACQNMRLEEGVGNIGHIPVLMLLDRVADVFLARQSGADGWLVKPLDSFRLRRAADAVAAGKPFSENFEATKVATTLGRI